MSGVQKRILVVEDEEPLQEMYREVFTNAGHSVDVAENGRIGFRKGATFDFDVVICDLQMPDWHGIDAIKSILLVKPSCRFIVVSGYADRKIADELRVMPEVLAIFAKPVAMDKLLAAIAAVSSDR
jgi:DNA-binding NtrC family response regulator